ncbi:MAG: anhydro-N-acetylmuramic acid kinase AnmK [Defluviitaleaceae bacterium]|nr:anhydro-N-acetylmuramic acid kinase AnmK [Defluviitaleaceae bacterium]
MKKLFELSNKPEKLVIGLMSGTSVDGIDAALVKIKGNFTDTIVEEIAFENFPFPAGMQERIFHLFEDATAKDICHMNFLLGGLFADAAIAIAKKAGIPIEAVDLIGSHGQTIYHIAEALEGDIRSTLQIGEGAVIAHQTGVVTICDFRTADMAAGGTGAPLVPYTEFLLYASQEAGIALQNIGGIGNITVIPKRAAISDVIAFDTGPGNMVIDAMVSRITNGSRGYDNNGEMAATGTVCREVISHYMQHDFIKSPPPKAAGRENFGQAFSDAFYARCQAHGLKPEDIVATATAFTAETIGYAIENHISQPVEKLVVGGGGSYNATLMDMIKKRLPNTTVCVQEDLGYNGDAKEAVAFAVLANETICGNAGNMPRVTGAERNKILGKICLP